MRTYALFGIDKYHSSHLLAVIRAESLEKAANSLGGRLSDVGFGERPRFRMYFGDGAECAVFSPGTCTAEVLAKACQNSGIKAEDPVGHYHYSFQNIFREAVIGTVPCLG